MEQYEQMELDVALESAKDLKTNLSKVIKFTHDKMLAEAEESSSQLKKVESKPEAYGIAATHYVRVAAKHKALKGQMEDFLKLLDAGDEVTQIAGTIYNASLELAMESIIMAANATRILDDLYYGKPRTPLEAYMDAQEGEDEGGEDFQDAEEQESREADDLEEEEDGE
ncbi:MAG: hypothetical protein PHV18_04415 [Lachnospiraceae bacterium]|nr:hypothetical protein [Lachnospiraceae bacterium]